MVFTINETQIYEELVQNSSCLSPFLSSPEDIFRRLAQQKKAKATTVATLKTYLHTLSYEQPAGKHIPA